MRKPGPRKRRDGLPMCRRTGCRRARLNSDVMLCALHEADRLFSLRIRNRDGRCVAGDRTDGISCRGVLQCAHVFSRGYHAIRWDDDNAVALCAAHHSFYTDRGAHWEAWCRARGVDWDLLRDRARSEPPVRPEEVLDKYGAR